MCGVVGLIGEYENPPNVLLSMNRILGHRGPDDEGFVLVDDVRSPSSRWRRNEPILHIKI